MNPHVAGGAVLVSPVEHVVRTRLRLDAIALAAEIAGSVMAFQTNRERSRAPQQAGVHRPVWIVADFTTIHANRRVLENKRAAFVGMTFQAWFLVRQGLIDHSRPQTRAPGGGKGAVRIVAIRALHEAFVDAML